MSNNTNSNIVTSPWNEDVVIRTEGLVKNFGKLQVLKGINEEIKKGEVVSIIGPSGSGKSTFLRCLNLLEQPTGGKIFFEGVGCHFLLQRVHACM